MARRVAPNCEEEREKSLALICRGSGPWSNRALAASHRCHSGYGASATGCSWLRDGPTRTCCEAHLHATLPTKPPLPRHTRLRPQFVHRVG